MTQKWPARIAATAAACLVPTTADAHLIGGRLGDFYGGLLHPLTSLESVVPWLALCLVAGLQPPKFARWIFLSFPLGLLAGVALASSVAATPFISVLNIASFIIAGVLAALALRLPSVALAALSFAFGVSHGFANGTEISGDMNWWLFTLGVVTAGFLFISIITALVTAFRRSGLEWRTIAIRAAGSWIAAIGIMLLGAREFMP